jgi:hypothetical protein
MFGTPTIGVASDRPAPVILWTSHALLRAARRRMEGRAPAPFPPGPASAGGYKPHPTRRAAAHGGSRSRAIPTRAGCRRRLQPHPTRRAATHGGSRSRAIPTRAGFRRRLQTASHAPRGGAWRVALPLHSHPGRLPPAATKRIPRAVQRRMEGRAPAPFPPGPASAGGYKTHPTRRAAAHGGSRSRSIPTRAGFRRRLQNASHAPRSGAWRVARPLHSHPGRLPPAATTASPRRAAALKDCAGAQS